ncbi:MAG: hypothetical protein LBP80_07410, partial [Treponema sp.]|nr:hypothetical protein [Treponema sp.]
MNLLTLKDEVFCKRYPAHEVRSVRKLFNCGVYYYFFLVLPILTALEGGLLDPTANKAQKARHHKKPEEKIRFHLGIPPPGRSQNFSGILSPWLYYLRYHRLTDRIVHPVFLPFKAGGSKGGR